MTKSIFNMNLRLQASSALSKTLHALLLFVNFFAQFYAVGPGCLSRSPDPIFWGFGIPDPTTTKKRRGKNLFPCLFCSHIYLNLKLLYF
jgi:hypothetical protein